MKKCGKCRWHFDLQGKAEQHGFKNCLQQPWPLVPNIWHDVTADCSVPEKYQPLGDDDNEHEPEAQPVAAGG
jgi:hypothetical protein